MVIIRILLWKAEEELSILRKRELKRVTYIYSINLTKIPQKADSKSMTKKIRKGRLGTTIVYKWDIPWKYRIISGIEER
jgi:hypothetical protein